MENITQKELQSLKEFIVYQDIEYSKLINYSDFAVDPQIKQIFNQLAENSKLIKEKLSIFLKKGE